MIEINVLQILKDSLIGKKITVYKFESNLKPNDIYYLLNSTTFFNRIETKFETVIIDVEFEECKCIGDCDPYKIIIMDGKLKRFINIT